MATVDHLPGRYEHWKRYPEKLVPQDEYVIVSICENSEGIKYKEETLQDSDIPAHCRKTATPTSDTKWSLELVVSAGLFSANGPNVVPYSLGSIEALRSHWHIPYDYVPSFGAAPEVSMAFTPILGNGNWKGYVQALTNKITVIHDSQTRRAFGVCLVEDIEAHDLKERLEGAKTFASNPLLAPVILLSMDVNGLRLIGRGVYEDCEAVEAATGYNDRRSENTLDQMADFTGIPQRLKVLSSRVATIAYFCSCIFRTIDRLENLLQGLQDVYSNDVSTALQEKMVYFRECSASISLTADRSDKLVQSMVQTVNAELQQRDNQLNHRYGADMRLITAITLIFLPATFVATFFSTTFWDFSPDNNGAKVTYWVYLYFVVTIGLTLLVLTVWRRFSAFKRLTMETVHLGRRMPLLGRLIREKKVDDVESGKKGD
ncbi:hypothetical protein BKA58DRAFT_423030 [Alternaria rosae]|uniref:uncharacterized protein n=1 Tax=Alternaria rosae TaxID=1187941 RepID=UPI001E8E6FCB|nr:uncharacterized protein BKA58DRAFT_423030 [Alternaria rosae]KAH6865754.1 hypothetical protein BKA58DRAFT_423030 [Alternaria rosae]